MESYNSEYHTPTLDRYLEKLGLSVADLEGKQILDIGAGNAYFAKEAWLKCRARVFSVDKNFFQTEKICCSKLFFKAVLSRCVISPSIEAWKESLERAVQALAQKLPFKNETFDLIVSVDAIPLVLNGRKDIESAFREALRALEPRGIFVLYPLEFPECDEKKKDDIATVIDDLKRQLRLDIKIEEAEDKHPATCEKITMRRLLLKKNISSPAKAKPWRGFIFYVVWAIITNKMNFIVIFVTTSSKKEADRISQVLLQEKFAACINIIPRIESFYWWKKKIEKSREVLMIIKTKKPFVSKIIKKVKELHSYKVPEIIALPIISGNKDYLSWLSDSLK